VSPPVLSMAKSTLFASCVASLFLDGYKNPGVHAPEALGFDAQSVQERWTAIRVEVHPYRCALHDARRIGEGSW